MIFGWEQELQRGVLQERVELRAVPHGPVVGHSGRDGVSGVHQRADELVLPAASA